MSQSTISMWRSPPAILGCRAGRLRSRCGCVIACREWDRREALARYGIDAVAFCRRSGNAPRASAARRDDHVREAVGVGAAGRLVAAEVRMQPARPPLLMKAMNFAEWGSIGALLMSCSTSCRPGTAAAGREEFRCDRRGNQRRGGTAPRHAGASSMSNASGGTQRDRGSSSILQFCRRRPAVGTLALYFSSGVVGGQEVTRVKVIGVLGLVLALVAACGKSDEEKAAEKAAEEAEDAAEAGSGRVRAAAAGAAEGPKGVRQGDGERRPPPWAEGPPTANPWRSRSFQALQTALPEMSGWEREKPRGERMTSPSRLLADRGRL